jgi:hypothetical protein
MRMVVSKDLAERLRFADNLRDTNFARLLGKVPPHPVLLPEERRNPRITRGGNSGILSLFGERNRVRGDLSGGHTKQLGG